MSEPVYTYYSALKQLEHCGFECEGGPLENNTAFQFLKRGKVPEFLIGQMVFVEIEYKDEVLGQTLKQWERVTITGCMRQSNATDVYYDYCVAKKPCEPYYAGGKVFRVTADKLRAEKPHD